MNFDDEVPAIDLSEVEIQRRFDELQKKLIPLWTTIDHLNPEEQTIVVVPSLTVDYPIQGSVLQAYEERFLFLLLLLRQPRARLIYVTSQVILPSIVEYYLGLLPGVIASHARHRLLLVTPQDGSPLPLSIKLLKRPRLIEKIRSLIKNPDRTHLLPFNTTRYERDLALRLGIPMYAADPKFLHFGTKSGSRKLFSEVGVFHPVGFENLHSMNDIVEAILKIYKKHPHIKQIIVKLNEGVSGDGNATVDLKGFDRSNVSTSKIRGCVEQMRFESPAVTLEEYIQKLSKVGGVVEERIYGSVFRSPSVQLRITPVGEVELLSTHDQLLGGPSGQSFLGSSFPADQSYALPITQESLKVGEYLAREGVIGRFAIDFVSARSDGDWKSYAIEINLRKGGTTHPFLTLQFLTDGKYDSQKAEFVTPSGQIKCFIASDHIESPFYRSLCPDEIFDIAVRYGLHFNQTLQCGVVFHMMSSLGEYGRMGFTAVENSHKKANILFKRTIDVFDREVRVALKQRPLPSV